MNKLYDKEILKELTVSVFNEYYTIYVLDDNKYYNIHILSDLFKQDELNTLIYQEPKEYCKLSNFDELTLTKDIIKFALWNKFYGYKNKSYIFNINNEIDIDFSELTA